jgi:hypothetical protein
MFCVGTVKARDGFAWMVEFEIGSRNENEYQIETEE